MEIKGIDVSSYQGKPNWKKAKESGIKYAILRIHQRNGIDSSFEYNYAECKKNNIPIGGYKFSYATTVAQAEKEAEDTLKVLNGRKLDYPLFYDLEWSTQRSLGSAMIEKITLAFLNKVKKAGYKVGIYCNVDWYNNVLTSKLKAYDMWLSRYPYNDTGVIQERLRPSVGIGWQYSSKGNVPGISGNVDMNVFYKDYANENANNTPQEGGDHMTRDQIIKNIRNDAVDFAVRMANDNKHGYSQRVRSLYNITNPTSFDCSSLTCTAYYYAFLKNGLKTQANYLKSHCSYTGNMLNMLNCGFEIVARNQTAHSKMVKGDLELNTTHHVAMAIDQNTIVHARSSEGTSDTKDNSGNEIRTQPWYLYSHGWTHRLRFTGKNINFDNISSDGSISIPTSTLLQYGDTGNDVKVLQQKLNKVGMRDANGKKLVEDGEFGSATKYAVRAFQEKYRLEVDGIAGKDTISKLDAVIASQNDSNTSGFESFVGACTTDNTAVYEAKTGTIKLKTYPKLNRGNLVDVISMSGNRYKIKIANKYTGWIDKARIVTPDKLTLNKPSATSKYPFVGECTGNDVNVRKNAGTNYSNISGWPKLNKGNRVDVLGEKKGTDGKKWYKIKITGKYIGYIRSDYIRKI